ncbi:hypothetical protein F2P56_034995 [Juglans regia]|uniref:FAS1 domain-containing protein n=2 Tax=Juglans regia TaxID=51240 RepID=A0A833T2W0_JUGRE|nr:putative fasciclin-like arabinogalactan protein 20 [Juglans regia]KAF5442325.1 hypothetical protein F2P56_034995 [Juglans regia]
MASSSVLLIVSLLLLLSPFSLSSLFPSDPILKAYEILSASGYESMAGITLELASRTLVPQSPSLTIFAPSDSAFVPLDYLPLSLVQYHLLPLAFSFQSLKSLPNGAKISTLLSGNPLIVTTSMEDYRLSLNNVTIPWSPIYVDGSLIIFGIDKFFDPNFQFLDPFPSHSPNLECLASTPNDAVVSLSGAYSFHEACATLRSKGCSVMASFLDMQFLELQERTVLTVFAPVDGVIKNRFSGFIDFSSSIFRRHVVPCRLLWGDLVNMEDGMVLRTYLDGFTINVTGSHDLLVLNNVPVIYPDMYVCDWLVVHGIRDILEAPKQKEEALGPPAEVPKQTEKEPESSPEMPNQTEQLADYSYQVVADYSFQVPEKTAQLNSSSEEGNSAEKNAIGHYHFSTFP